MTNNGLRESATIKEQPTVSSSKLGKLVRVYRWSLLPSPGGDDYYFGMKSKKTHKINFLMWS